MKGEKIKITKHQYSELIGMEGTVLEHDLWDGRIWMKLDKPFPPHQHNVVLLPERDDFEYANN